MARSICVPQERGLSFLVARIKRALLCLGIAQSGLRPGIAAGALRKHSWSSFQAYVGLGLRNDFVHYEPVLALLGGRKDDREARYRQFVETGVAENDDEFAAAMWRSAQSIGSADFREDVDERYRTLLKDRRVPEDVSFRRVGNVLPAQRILAVVAAVVGVKANDLTVRQRDNRWRAVTARMLCRYGGLTQRRAAGILGVRTGVAVSCQLRKLTGLLQSDPGLQEEVSRVERRLKKELERVGVFLSSKG